MQQFHPPGQCHLHTKCWVCVATSAELKIQAALWFLGGATGLSCSANIRDLFKVQKLFWTLSVFFKM